MSGHVHEGTVDVTWNDDVAIVTMNCGDNRISGPFVDKMQAALDQVLSVPSVRGMITTGCGRFYSNGVDLLWAARLAETDMSQFEDFFRKKVRDIQFRILTFPVPTVAIVNGHAMGGGAVLSLVHDHVILNDSAIWCLPEVKFNLGFHPAMIEYFRFRLNRIHVNVMTDAVLLGRKFRGEEALHAGIADEVCSSENMMARALIWLKQVLPPSGFDKEHLQIMRQDINKNVMDIRYVEARRPVNAKI